MGKKNYIVYNCQNFHKMLNKWQLLVIYSNYFLIVFLNILKLVFHLIQK
ncbi:unnamed protein product [Meloidogyne enterolobii]|uniref:Uncharacterized protein n=1 Tax=Meloidogyne enterolobii TaxID=390850 RepID=A0ACB0ZVI4_MELEN